MIKGQDVRIHETAIIKRPELVTLGDRVAIDPFFYMTTGAKIGNDVHINSHVSVIGGEKANLVIANRVAISTGCRLICRSDDLARPGFAIPWLAEAEQTPKYGHSIILGEGVILGANVTVLPGCEIGEGTVVGAGAIVTEDLLSHGVYIGAPARRIQERD